MPTDDRRANESVLVVVERAAATPLWNADWGPTPDEGWSMLEQEEWEPAAAFAERLQLALERQATETCQPTVLLVTSAQDDEAAMSERWSLSSVVLGHFTSTAGGRLLLTGGYGQETRAAFALSSLAEELSDEWATASIAIDVRAGRVSRPPGARRVSPSREPRWAGSDHSALA
jgi:hypothetical protein